MKFSVKLLSLMLIICTLAGCDLNNCAVWSPDGSKFGLIEDNQFRLSSANGELSRSLIDKKIVHFSWFSDSKKIAIVSEKALTAWDAVRPNLTDKEVQNILKAAPILKDAIKSCNDDLNKIWIDFPSLDTETTRNATLVYLNQRYKDKLMVANADNRKSIDQSRVALQSIETYDVSSVVKQIQHLYHTTCDIKGLNISPDDNHIAFVEKPLSTNLSTKPSRLLVIQTDGGSPLPVSSNCSDAPAAWLNDSKALVFSCINEVDSYSSKSSSDLTVGVIKQTKVCDNNGHLLGQIAETQVLAYVPYSDCVLVSCTKDNSVIFSAPELQLPATPVDTKGNLQLFKISPGSIPTIMRLSPRQFNDELGDKPMLFIPSPDGQYAAVLGGTGKVGILNLHTGQFQIPECKEFEPIDNSVYLMPDWKNSDELTFVAHSIGKSKTNHKADLFLWSVSQQSSKLLSKDWPDETMKALF